MMYYGMRNSMKYLLILLTTAAFAYEFNNIEYLRAYDGDTVTVNIKNVHPLLGKKISIRVKGIDTPEIKGKTECEKKKAIEARDFVRDVLSKAKKLELKESSRGKYFRIVAFVIYDGKNLSDELIKAGLAVPYDGGAKVKKDWCEK